MPNSNQVHSRKRLMLWVAMLTAAVVGATFTPTVALASPNPFTPRGESWVTVEESKKVYFEDFGNDHDDNEIFLVPEGVTCTRNSITASGPFLSADTVGAAQCGGTDPINSSTRAGAIAIGFDVNFYGTTYSDLYISTNGGIFFDNPSSDYDQSLTQFAIYEESSLISPLTLDLYYDKEESNLWVAQTTVGGKKAFVVAWEEFDACCTSASPDEEAASFQFVFIDNGSGNFTAYFNYDKFVNIDQGYDQVFDVDMRNAVTVGSNIVTVPVTHPLVEGQCVEVDDDNYGPGSLTDSSWDNNANYVKLHSETQISVWQDSACTVPNNISAIQSIPVEYVALYVGAYDFEAAGIGWATYDADTGETDATELFGNIDRDTLFDNGSSPIINYSRNTTVPGRVVIGMSGGETITENVADPEVVVAPQPKADRLPKLDQEGTVLASSGGDLVLTGQRLYCTNEVKINGSVATFSHSASSLGNGSAELRIKLPTLDPGYHQISMDSCGGFVTYDRFLFVPKAPVVFEGKVTNGFERAMMLISLQSWVREHRVDFNSVQCTVNTKSLSLENATLLVRDMCSKTFGLLASPKSQSTVVKENSTQAAIWYRVILSTQ